MRMIDAFAAVADAFSSVSNACRLFQTITESGGRHVASFKVNKVTWMWKTKIRVECPNSWINDYSTKRTLTLSVV